MKHVYRLIAVVIIASIFAGCKKKEIDTIQIASMVGNVRLIADNKQEFTPHVGDIVKKGDTLVTGSNSLADIMFAGYGIIRVHADTTVVMKSLLDEITGDTSLDMNKGKLYVTVSKLKKGSFNVKTPTLVASIRGTSFRVTADPAMSRLDVVSGAVRINPVKNDTVVTEVEQVVETNQTVKIDEKAVEKAVTKKEIAVEPLKPEEIKEIREEVKDIKPELIEKLKEDSRKEIIEIKEQIKEKAPEKEPEDQSREQKTPPRPAVIKKKEAEQPKIEPAPPETPPTKQEPQKGSGDKGKKLLPDGPTTL